MFLQGVWPDVSAPSPQEGPRAFQDSLVVPGTPFCSPVVAPHLLRFSLVWSRFSFWSLIAWGSLGALISG